MAVMVLDAFAPFAPQQRVVHAGENGGVFNWNGGLIIIAVQRPGLHLLIGAKAGVQPVVKAVLVVIARRADLAQGRFQFGRGKQGCVGCLCHRTTSIPS